MTHIQQQRKARGMSQAQLGRLLGVHQTAVSKWELGVTYPDMPTLIRLAQLWEVSVDYLLDKTDQPQGGEGVPAGELDQFTYALQNETKDLTQADKELLLSMARQLKDARKRRKDGETD